MLQTDTRTVYDADLNLFRDQVRKFFARALIPNLDRWEEEGVVDREFWKACGEAGLLCPQVPEEYGGLGADYRYNAVIGEELLEVRESQVDDVLQLLFAERVEDHHVVDAVEELRAEVLAQDSHDALAGFLEAVFALGPRG